jgi:hypothetical protein
MSSSAAEQCVNVLLLHTGPISLSFGKRTLKRGVRRMNIRVLTSNKSALRFSSLLR